MVVLTTFFENSKLKFFCFELCLLLMLFKRLLNISENYPNVSISCVTRNDGGRGSLLNVVRSPLMTYLLLIGISCIFYVEKLISFSEIISNQSQLVLYSSSSSSANLI